MDLVTETDGRTDQANVIKTDARRKKKNLACFTRQGEKKEREIFLSRSCKLSQPRREVSLRVSSLSTCAIVNAF